MERQERKSEVRIVRDAEMHWVGDGFPVRSVFSYNDLGQELSPFLLLDHAAPYKFEPAKVRRGVGAHPHRGFETVTIAYQGELEHRDSAGGGGTIGPGDVQWMTAASGLIHEEFHSQRFTESGGVFEMVQLWINLPARCKSEKPAYQTLLRDTIPTVTLEHSGAKVRLIAGHLNGTSGPARTFTPINLWDVTISANQRLALPLAPEHTRALLVLQGAVEVAEQQASAGELIIIAQGGPTPELRTLQESKLLVLSGEPIDEPVVGYGPFVMNSEAEIKKAFADYQAGKLGRLPTR